MTCVHLGKCIGQTVELQGVTSVYGCKHPKHETTTLAQCEQCPDKQEGEYAPPQSEVPATPFRDWQNRPLFIDGLYRGAAGFLICGGPSVKQLPLEQLNRRGILICSFNNNAVVLPNPIRPHVWLHSDPTRKFHDAIWRDPAVLKFSPVKEWSAARKNLWKKGIAAKLPDGRIVMTGKRAIEMPAVIGYERSYDFNPNTFLTEPTVNRGNDKDHLYNGWPHIVNTMFSAIRICFSLGIQRLYLVGADFRMSVNEPYAFGEKKSKGGVIANNRHFREMDHMLTVLRPIFDTHGFVIFNTFEHSGLKAFDHKPFTECIDEASEHFPAELDCAGYYQFDPEKQGKPG